MSKTSTPIFIGDTIQQPSEGDVKGEFVTMLGETFYRIQNYDHLAPFFMSIVSSSNHWLFISSSGGLSAGRVSAEQSLFPYYTEDKLTENNENTGSKSILLVRRGERRSLWEPFSERYKGSYRIERNLYKNVLGTALVFEEINFSLGLSFRYAWRTSDVFGFVKTAWLKNLDDSACQVELLDGIQNILPANITSLTQNTFSPLLDAYKRSEVDPNTGLAIFALNSTLTDLAEPSESLLATTVMQLGLEQADYLALYSPTRKLPHRDRREHGNRNTRSAVCLFCARCAGPGLPRQNGPGIWWPMSVRIVLRLSACPKNWGIAQN